MYRDPLVIKDDFQALLDICKINENINDNQFYLGSWKTICGTKGCLIGNWIMYGENTKMRLDKGFPYIANTLRDEQYTPFLEIAKRLQIGYLTSEFLFNATTPEPLFSTKIRDHYNRLEALSRLRKYIYYRLHKREMLGDLSTKEGREKYEKIRRTEGNHNIIARTLEQCLIQ